MDRRDGVASLLTLATLAGCGGAGQSPRDEQPFDPVYRGIETRLLDRDLVEFVVEMKGARGVADVDDYARCAAAQYALIRGYGFARHVRTRIAQEAGVWRADAVYTVSPALPKGSKTIDAEVTVDDCSRRDIPTV